MTEQRMRSTALILLATAAAIGLATSCNAMEPLVSETPSELQANCGCTLTGRYVEPATVIPSASSAAFTASTSVSGGVTTLSVTRKADHVEVFHVQIAAPLAFGFSPDGNRFLYRHVDSGVDNLSLVNLAQASPAVNFQAAVATASSASVFSPNGKYLLYAYVMPQSNVVNVQIVDAERGRSAPIYSTALTIVSQPGSDEDQLGVASWGFSPDDETFVAAYVTGRTTVQWSVVDVVTRREVASKLITATSSFWQFSPCGDVIGLAEADPQARATVSILRTSDGRLVGTASGQAAPGGVVLSTTATHQVVTINTTTTQLPNQAAAPCPTAVALAAVSVSPASVQGGSPATGTVTLTGPAPSGGTRVDLGSSNTAAAGTPSSVTVAAGASSATFAVTTHGVTSSVAVTLRATVGTVTQTASLQVLAPTTSPPRPVSGLSLAPSSVEGGSSGVGTVTLTGSTGTTTVNLSSSDPELALVPASIVIASGATSGTFTIATTAVTAPATVHITASAAGASATADLELTPPAASGAHAILDDAGCRANTLPANDDGSTNAVTLASPVNFFGTVYTFLFINNNGNVTFRAPMSTFTPFTITASTPPIIAPFFGDVDTRGSGSSPVTYSFGPVDFGGRPAMCINWVNVGYFAAHVDKLNSFQLLLVDRSDVNPGDFDIVMNYDRIQWETGDASGGVNGLGGTSAGAGYSAGTGDPAQFFQFPGSLVHGGLLDSNPGTGLTSGSRNSLVQGRHIFAVRNGSAPAGGTVTGVVTDAATPPHALAGAPVQVCRQSDGRCVFVTLTNSAGQYNATGLAEGDYLVTALAPAGSSLTRETVGPVHVTPGSSQVVDLVLHGPTPPPAGVTLVPSSSSPGALPVLFWGTPITLTAQGCAAGSASYTLVGDSGTTFASGSLSEVAPGVYSAVIPPVRPNHGPAHIHIAITCPGGDVSNIDFDVYIDPSGVVRTLAGDPIPGATVTLLRSDSTAGPFEVVPDGSPVMSPMNRSNPQLSDAIGHFGWDVITGFYIVRAQADGCAGPNGEPFVETAVLSIPPAITDLDLRLACAAASPADTTPPTTTASVSSQPSAAGWYRLPPTVALVAVDDQGGSGVASISYTMTGAESVAASVFDTSAELAPRADGQITIEYRATDVAENVESPQRLALRIDQTPPAISCVARPKTLWPPNNKLVAVHVDVTATDATSGVAGFRLVSVTSSDDSPRHGRDCGPNDDIVGFVPGQASVDGKLRAKHDVVYTFVYEAVDHAGNSARCETDVRVTRPHEYGDRW